MRRNERFLITEPLTGKETSEIVAEIYRTAGPRLGPRLVESNIVITLAGARGHTEFFIHNSISEDRNRIDQANQLLVDKGIRMRAHKDTFSSASTGIKTLMVSLENLRGYERTSCLSHLPGVTPFNSSSGWKGFASWWKKTSREVSLAAKEGILRLSNRDIDTVLVGIIKGYPDQAILDFCDWLSTGRSKKIISIDLPQISFYGGAQPLFDYYSEHKQDPNIQDAIKTWGRILDEFYSSPWHQMIKEDPTFKQTREAIDKNIF